MTEKRFDIMNGIELGTHSGIWDNQKQHNRGIGDELWVGEIVGLLNALNNENQALKERRHVDINDLSVIAMKYKALEEENEQLKQEIAKFKEWEKHIGGVKREDLDRVFKMSIYEIAEAFEYYRKKIKELSE